MVDYMLVQFNTNSIFNWYPKLLQTKAFSDLFEHISDAKTIFA